MDTETEIFHIELLKDSFNKWESVESCALMELHCTRSCRRETPSLQKEDELISDFCGNTPQIFSYEEGQIYSFPPANEVHKRSYVHRGWVTPSTVKSGQFASYWYVFLLQVAYEFHMVALKVMCTISALFTGMCSDVRVKPSISKLHLV